MQSGGLGFSFVKKWRSFKGVANLRQNRAFCGAKRDGLGFRFATLGRITSPDESR
ncbi:hypothetical protein ACVM3D_001574 [Campylobacter upsaliensis]